MTPRERIREVLLRGERVSWSIGDDINVIGHSGGGLYFRSVSWSTEDDGGWYQDDFIGIDALMADLLEDEVAEIMKRLPAEGGEL